MIQSKPNDIPLTTNPAFTNLEIEKSKETENEDLENEVKEAKTIKTDLKNID